MARRSMKPPLAAALLLQVWAPYAAGDCFENDTDYKAPENRANVTYQGVEMPFGIFVLDWDSAQLFDNVAKILIEEKLGVNTNFSGKASTTWPGFFAIGRCRQWDNSTHPECGPPEDFPLEHHILLEAWSSSMTYDHDWFGANHPQDQQEKCGEFSFPGFEGHFVRTSTMERALHTSGEHLNIHSYYNSSWNQPAKFFNTRVSEIPTDRLKPCAFENRLHNPGFMLPIAQRYNLIGSAAFDADGKAVCDSGGYWWFSPACRHKASTCVPYITGGDGWELQNAVARSLAFSMPMAVAVSSSWSMYISNALTYDVTYYSWEPSLHLIASEPQEITFPLHNAEQWAAGDKSSMAKKVILQNFAGRGTAQNAPAISYLFTRFDFPLSQLMHALQDVAGGSSYDQAACAWLKRTDIWKPWVQAMQCPDGEGMIDTVGTDRPGWKFVLNHTIGKGCGQCEPGRYSAAYSDPVQCVPGQACFESRVCQACPAGTAQIRYNQMACDVCQPGSYQPSPQQLRCLSCAVGTYSNSSGSSLCRHCGEDTAKFLEATMRLRSNDSDNASFLEETEQAKKNRATMKRVVVDGEERWAFQDGAFSSTSCGCTIGAWENGGVCQSCTDEMDCPGMGHIFIKPYYFSPADRPGYVFKCHGSSGHRCPGGLPGTCSKGRRNTSVACALCEPMMKAGSNGECETCAEGDYAPSILLVVVLLLGMVFFYRVVDVSKPAGTSSAVLMFAMAASLMVTMFQQLGVFGSINLQWQAPFSDVLDFLSIFTFDLEYLSLDCMGAIDPFAKYLLRVFMVILFVLIMVLIHIVSVLALYRGAFKERMPALVGSIGLVFSAFFISIVSSMTAPFMCLPHPNGMRTVRDYPDVLCFHGGTSSRHFGMVICAAVATLIPVGFLIGVVWVVWKLPEKLANGDTGFLITFRFLLFRFRPACYWHVCIFLVRNMLMAIIPAIGIQTAQILMLQCILLPYLAVTVRTMPLSLYMANCMDILASMMLCMLLIVFALFVEDSQVDAGSMATVCVVLLGLGLFGVIGGMVYAIFLRFLRRGKPFGYFICHHKLGAGNFARLLKVVFQQATQVKKKVFVDSDDLRDLSTLFDFVRSDTETLVVVCTKEIFMRPWCVGEVCTAQISDTRVVKVVFPAFEWPDQSFIDEYENNVPDVSSLASFGISVEMVQGCIRWLENQATVFFPLEVSNDTARQLLTILTKPGSLREGFKTTIVAQQESVAPIARTTTDSGGGRNFILADVGSIEAACAALVLHKLLMPIMNDPPIVLQSTDGLAATAKQICLICTTGAFRSALVVTSLALIAQRNLAVLPLVSETSFRFPTKDMFADICVSSHAVLASRGVDMSGEAFIRIVARVFKEIAIEFNPQDAEDILIMRSQAVHMRLKSSLLRPLHVDLSANAEAANEAMEMDMEVIYKYGVTVC